MSVSVFTPFPVFADADGLPLESGFVYIGVANLDPVTNPTAVFWDEALSIPAAQPLRTSAGVIVRSGAPANVYVAGDHSIAVHDQNNEQVSTLDVTAGLPVTGGSITLAAGESLTALSGSDIVVDDGAEVTFGDGTGVGVLTTYAANARIVGSLIPNVNDGGNLGSLTRKWASIYATDVVATNVIASAVSGDSVAGYNDTTEAATAVAALALNQQKNTVACGRVSSTGTIGTNHFNIASVTVNSPGNMTVTLDEAIEDDAVVIAQPTGTSSGLEVRAAVVAGGASITFIQYQATVLTSLNFTFVVFGRPRGGVPSPV